MISEQTFNDVFSSVLHKPFTPQNMGTSLAQIERAIQSRFPGGVDVAVIVRSSLQGWTQVWNSKGIIAVLIGVVAARDAAAGRATGYRQHKPYLKPGGSLGISAVDDWQQLGGFHTITWT